MVRALRDLVVLGLCGLTAAACVEADDDPSLVHDLRVLGVAFDRPELMAPDCASLLDGTPDLTDFLASFATPLQMRALVVDPAGGGRDIAFDVAACAGPDDETCTENPDERVELLSGTMTEGEWSGTIEPGLRVLPDGTPLLVQVFANDPYQGLGGIRLSVVLHLVAGEEEIYAHKLMVYSCKAYDDSTENVTPQLPGLRFDGNPWTADAPPAVQGNGQVTLTPEPLTGLEEAYVVPSLSLAPVHLKESWRISWYTTQGSIGPLTTGGVDLGGEEGRHEAVWTPRGDADAGTVRFFVVVRDGRGGESWEQRTVQFAP